MWYYHAKLCFRNIKKNNSNFITAVKRFKNIMSYRQKFIYTEISRFKTRLISQNEIVFNLSFRIWTFRWILVSQKFYQSWEETRLKIISRGLQFQVLQSFNILIHIWSCPWALLGSKFWIIFAMLSVEKVIDDKQLCIKYSSLLGSSLLLLIRQHWSAKKELKSSAFFLNQLQTRSCDTVVEWLLLRKILSKDQYVLELLWVFWNFSKILK